MSFDLYVFPAPAPANPADVRRLMDETEARLGANLTVPTPGHQMQEFLAELGRRWPSPDGDRDASPWAFWPLWQPVGAGTGLNIRWSRATAMRSEIVALAARLGLTVYDPQDEVFIEPDDWPKRAWFRRGR